jgi:hypothetical protein
VPEVDGCRVQGPESVQRPVRFVLPARVMELRRPDEFDRSEAAERGDRALSKIYKVFDGSC